MAEPISYNDFAKLELRVAKVLEVRPHPNADRLLLLQVDIGAASNFATALAQASEQLVHLSLSTSLDAQRALEMTRRAESDARPNCTG